MNTDLTAELRLRLALGAIGLGGIAFGAVYALTHLFSDLPTLVLWLAIPVLLTDAVASPIALALAWAGRLVLPRAVWGAAAVALVVSGSLVAVAVLTRAWR